jgi:hypothetical protein
MGVSRMALTVAGAAAAIIASDVYLLHKIGGLDRRALGIERSIADQFTRVRQMAVAANDAQHQSVLALMAELRICQQQAVAAAARARTQAQRYAEGLVRHAAHTHREELAEVSRELANVRQTAVSTGEAAQRLNDELHASSENLPATGASPNLTGVAGDVRTLKAAAAHQHTQLAALKAMAERKVFAFSMKKGSHPVEVAGFRIWLRKTNTARGSYVIDLSSGGPGTERWEGTVREPIRFYAPNRRFPCELVVSEMSKDAAQGYVTVPAATTLARSYSSGSAETRNLPER